MILETERLILRKWTQDDAESLFTYAKNPKVGPIAGWPPHKDIESSKYVIDNIFTGAECYAICEKENNVAIGAVELKLNGHTDMTDRDDECELGYWLGEPFWGRGYMPEAAYALMKRGFETLEMTTIWCGYYDGNKSKFLLYSFGLFISIVIATPYCGHSKRLKSSFHKCMCRFRHIPSAPEWFSQPITEFTFIISICHVCMSI